jgi:acyl carrier protein
MSHVRDRLSGCFLSVFRELTPEHVAEASADVVGTWDSTNHFLLVQVVEEEFSVRIPEELVAELDSFNAFEGYLVREVSNG